MPSSIFLPKILQVGGGALSRLPDTMDALGCQHPCIISDKTMLALGYVAQVEALLKHRGIGFGVFTDTVPEPDDESIQDAVALVKREKFDSLIALGGGSVIDSAKAIALLATHGGQMRDYKMPYQVKQISIPVIAIPTTAGTGSEATRATVIADAQTDEKMLCMGIGFIPAAAIIDYQLTLSLPSRIAADTGIDALTHAIEAYVSRKANPFSDQQAIAAIKLIAPNLISVCQQPENRKAKEEIMLGATLAGIAFSNASVGLVHGMSRPLGVHFHVPHGMSNAMLLPTITEFSLPGAATRYAQCAQFMGLVNDTKNEDFAHKCLLDRLTAINRALSVPSLSEFGVKKPHFYSLIKRMAQQAIDSGSPANNPRVPSTLDIETLYKQVW